MKNIIKIYGYRQIYKNILFLLLNLGKNRYPFEKSTVQGKIIFTKEFFQAKRPLIFTEDDKLLNNQVFSLQKSMVQKSFCYQRNIGFLNANGTQEVQYTTISQYKRIIQKTNYRTKKICVQVYLVEARKYKNKLQIYIIM